MALHQHEGHRRRHGVGRRDGGEPQLGVHDPQGGDHHPAKFLQNRLHKITLISTKSTSISKNIITLLSLASHCSIIIGTIETELGLP